MQSRVWPGEQGPSPPQAPDSQAQAAEHVRGRVPQLPQGSLLVAPGEQTPPPVQAPGSHEHEALHVSVLLPQFPHGSLVVSPGEHAPWDTHSAASHWPFVSHTRRRVPHLSHWSRISSSPGTQPPAPAVPPVSLPALPPWPASPPAPGAPALPPPGHPAVLVSADASWPPSTPPPSAPPLPPGSDGTLVASLCSTPKAQDSRHRGRPRTGMGRNTGRKADLLGVGCPRLRGMASAGLARAAGGRRPSQGSPCLPLSMWTPRRGGGANIACSLAGESACRGVCDTGVGAPPDRAAGAARHQALCSF